MAIKVRFDNDLLDLEGTGFFIESVRSVVYSDLVDWRYRFGPVTVDVID